MLIQAQFRGRGLTRVTAAGGEAKGSSVRRGRSSGQLLGRLRSAGGGLSVLDTLG